MTSNPDQKYRAYTRIGVDKFGSTEARNAHIKEREDQLRDLVSELSLKPTVIELDCIDRVLRLTVPKDKAKKLPESIQGLRLIGEKKIGNGSRELEFLIPVLLLLSFLKKHDPSTHDRINGTLSLVRENSNRSSGSTVARRGSRDSVRKTDSRLDDDHALVLATANAFTDVAGSLAKIRSRRGARAPILVAYINSELPKLARALVDSAALDVATINIDIAIPASFNKYDSEIALEFYEANKESFGIYSVSLEVDRTTPVFAFTFELD